jgi:transposase-like protein
MKTYLRRSWSAEDRKKMIDSFLNGMSLTDISDSFKIYYLDLRYILATEFGTHQLLRHRKIYWQEKGKPVPSNKSKSIAISCDLLMNKDLSYADIAKKNNCSRERVGQIAEIIASCGHKVSRQEKQKRGK